MDLTTGIRLFILSACLVAPVGAAHAEESDTQLWLNGAVGGSLGEGFAGALDVSQRFREGRDQVLVRGTIDWKLTPHVSLGGGLAYIESGNNDEVRPHQYVNLTFGQFSLRSMLEERFLQRENRTLIRLRERAQLLVPLSDRTKLAAAGEVYFILRRAVPSDDRDVEQYRASIGLRHSFSPDIEGAVTYLLIYTPRPGAADKVSHVPQLTLAFKL